MLRALPGFAVIFPLACAGLIGMARRKWGHSATASRFLLMLFGLAAAASVVTLVVGLRYRMPLVPVLAILAGTGLDSIVRAVQERRLAELGGYAAAATAAVLVSHALHDPRNTNVAEEWALTGSALITEHRLIDAEAAYRRALQLDPRSGLAWDGLGLALYDAGRLSDAAPALVRALEIDPDSSRATFHLALVHERAGDLSAAAEGYARALTLSPFDAEVAGHLGEATRKRAVELGMAGRTAEARDAMKRAVALLPDNGEAWLDLSLLSLDLGDRAAAAEALQRARERGANPERVAFAANALAK